MRQRYYFVLLFALLIAVTFCIGCTSDNSDFSEKTTSKSMNKLVPDSVGNYEKVSQKQLYSDRPTYYEIVFEPKNQPSANSYMEIYILLEGFEDKWAALDHYNFMNRNFAASVENRTKEIGEENLFGLTNFWFKDISEDSNNQAVDYISNYEYKLVTYAGNVTYIITVCSEEELSDEQALEIQKEILKGIINNY